MFLPSTNHPTLKVAIYRTSSIGDVVLATSCIDLLKNCNMPVEITWVGKEPSSSLLKAAYPELKIIDFDSTEKISSIIKELSDVHFMIDLQTSLRSRGVSKLLKSQYDIPTYVCDKAQMYRIKLLLEARLFGRSRSLPPKNLVPVHPQYLMMSNTLLNGLKKHLPNDTVLDSILHYVPIPKLPTEHWTVDYAWLKELKFDNWIAIAPGAAHGTKRAPVSVFVEVIKTALEKVREKNTSFGILVVGNNEDRAYGVEILEKLSWTNPSLNLAGSLSLWETALALKEVKVLLSNDSSLGHIAEAVNTDTAVLFGPTIEGFGFASRKKSSKTFSSLLGCRPCSKHGKSPCRFKDKKCFTNLPIARIGEFLANKFIATKED